MADLDQVVEFHPVADDRGVGLGAVDAGVGADLHVVLDDHVAQLGDLVEAPRGVGHEAEAVGADHGPGVEDAAAAHRAALVDLHPGVEDRLLAHRRAGAHVALGVDLRPAADLRARLDHGEVAHVAVVAHLGTLGDRGAGADAPAAGLGGVVHLEQPEHAGCRVVDLDERRRDRLRGHERLVDQHDRRVGRVEEGFVFGVGQVGQRTLVPLLDGGYGVHLGLFVADDFALQQSGDHFGSEFHHKYSVL